MRRPLPLFLLFLAGYLAVIAWGWFQQGTTAGELPGHAAKIEAILRLLRQGDFAWFPDYLTGSPSATLLSFGLSIPIYAPALLLIPDMVVAMKVTGLVLLALSGLAAYAFGRRLAGDAWAGFAIGCAWLLAPQLLLRLGWQEHMTIVATFPLVPLTFYALLRTAERGAPFDALLLAASFSATMLAWSKMGATMALPLALFAAWLFATRPECRTPLLRGALWAVPAVLLLAVAPLLPLLRERAFMTVFEFDPFAGAQQVYSVKTATAWFDRAGELFRPLTTFFTIDHGGYYLGLTGLAAVAGVVGLTWRDARRPREVAVIRLFLLLTLAMFWISYGPRNVLSGHLQLLAQGMALPDLVFLLHWLALAAQGAFIFWCIPQGRWRVPAFLGIFAVYLFVPAFKLIEPLPLYGDLRAPDSFWILNGTFAWAVASALSLVFLLRHFLSARLRPLVASLALAAACADMAPYFACFYKGQLSADVLSKYHQAIDKLREGSGRVFVVSNRYFYLDLPLRAARPLSTEALNRYLTPASSMRLQAASLGSMTDMLTYLQLSGVRDVLIDIGDQTASEQYRSFFHMLLPMGSEDNRFTIFANPLALYPGFFAETAAPAESGYREYPQALSMAREQILTIASPAGRAAELPGIPAHGPARNFERLQATAPRTPSRVTFSAPGRAGWIVLSESWHPDWRATVDGRPAVVYRGAGAFPAVPVTADSKAVEFHFEPPAWYAISLGASAFAWLGILGMLLAAPVLPCGFRNARIAVPSAAISNAPVTRPLVIVPTYNEIESIDELLRKVLSAGEAIHALIVDDSSPDGTAARVRGGASFGDRVHLLERPAKQGLGSAYRQGFQWALDRGYDACIEIDADLSHDPADIPRLVSALNEGADAAIGSRYLGGMRVVNWPRRRMLLSTGASRYVRALTGLPLTDTTSGFKALRASALAAIDSRELRTDGYGFQIELHWLLWKQGFRLVEVPITFTERRAGATKMTTAIAIEAARRVLQLAFSWSPRPR